MSGMVEGGGSGGKQRLRGLLMHAKVPVSGLAFIIYLPYPPLSL